LCDEHNCMRIIVSSSNDNYRVCGEKSFKTNAIYHIIINSYKILLFIVVLPGGGGQTQRTARRCTCNVSVQITEMKNQLFGRKIYSACVIDYGIIILYCVLENRSAECTGSGSCPVLRLTALRALPFPLARKKMTETVLANALLTEYNIHKNYMDIIKK